MTPERLRELKFQVRRHMNGEVAQIMRGLDDSYKANYGISLQHAKEVAAAEDLSADDCTELWATGWRDLMLIAAAAMSRHNPEPDVILKWVRSVPTVEMADALPFLLTGVMPEVISLANGLRDRDEGYDFAVAVSSIARAIVARQAPEFFEPSTSRADTREEWLEGFAPLVTAAADFLNAAMARAEWSFAEARAVSFLARQWCRLRRYGDIFGVDVRSLSDRLRNDAARRGDPSAAIVAKDIESEDEFVDSLL